MTAHQVLDFIGNVMPVVNFGMLLLIVVYLYLDAKTRRDKNG
jgi:hypothetical protein